MASLPMFRSRYGSSFGVNITKPAETLTWLGGDFFWFTSSPLCMPTMRTSRPSTSGLKGAPGASLHRVTNSSECSSGAVSLVFLVSVGRRRKFIADMQSQPIAPEAPIPQEPLDVGRTWASVPWLLSRTNRKNAVTHRMASALGVSSCKDCLLSMRTFPFLRFACRVRRKKDKT